MPITANLSVHGAFTSTGPLLQPAKIVNIRQNSQVTCLGAHWLRGENTDSSEVPEIAEYKPSPYESTRLREDDSVLFGRQDSLSLEFGKTENCKKVAHN